MTKMQTQKSASMVYGRLCACALFVVGLPNSFAEFAAKDQDTEALKMATPGPAPKLYFA